jgi:hypothetical protein
MKFITSYKQITISIITSGTSGKRYSNVQFIDRHFDESLKDVHEKRYASGQNDAG